jgi:hypothetical protein
MVNKTSGQSKAHSISDAKTKPAVVKPKVEVEVVAVKEEEAAKEQDNTTYYVMAAAAVGMLGLGAYMWNKKK